MRGTHQPARALDFYDLKGALETILARFTMRRLYVDALELPAWLHPGRSARVVADGLTLGFFGQLHPTLQQQHGLRQAAWLGELQLDRLFTLPLRASVSTELSRFQPVARDYSLRLPASLPWERVAGALDALAIPELVSYRPAEIFHPSGQQDADRISLLLSVTFQASDRTLTDEELHGWSAGILDAVQQLGGRLRA